MKVLTQPVIEESPHDEDARTAKEWLDALVSGECSLRVFLADTAGLLRGVPDTGWDLLALVDQYYRRGKISAELFGTVKAHLQGLLVGKGTDAEVSMPLPAMQDERPRKASPTVAMTAPDAADETPVPEDATHPAAPRTPAVGDVLRDRYRVQGVLGRGGMGTVFAAADQYRVDRSGADQRIAIKVLHTEVIKRPRLFAELRREFQHLQSLSHPNIVRVHEFDRDGDLAFFTMEYLSGALLSRVLSDADSGILYRPFALAIIRDVGAAIAHAHGRGVVHGDLNPANIFITDEGEVRVLDFGASHQLHQGPWISEFDDQRPLAMATPTFASCQVLEGEVADARDDVYALACIAYVLLAGKHPFNDTTALRARTARAVPDRPKGLTGRQWKALREGLQFNRDRRPPDIKSWLGRLDLSSAAQRLPALQNLMEHRPRRRGAMTWSAAVALLTLAAAGAGVFAVHDFSSVRTGNAVQSWITSVFPHGAPLHTNTSIPLSDDEDASGRRPAGAIEPSAKPPADVGAPPTRTTQVAPPPIAHQPAAAIAPAATAAATGPIAVQNGTVAGPNGNAPHARIELAADNVEVPAGDAMARIVVRRSRAFREEVSFKWWTESGTAKPGQDFVPVRTQIEYIENGKTSTDLVVPLVMDPARRGSRSFYVVIDETSDNAALGLRTLTMVTIPGAE